MKNCFAKAIAILLVVLCVLNCSGCYGLFTNKSVVVDWGRHYGLYRYSDKAEILYFDQSRKYGSFIDKLGIYCNENEENHEGSVVLEGHFKKFTHSDGKIIILMEDKYYVFDIDEYTYPPSNVGMEDYLEENDWFREYSIEEFNSEFPNNDKYHWIDD